VTAPGAGSTRDALDRLRRRVAALGGLPTLPAIAAEVLRAARDPAATVVDMTARIARDPPLAARVLKVANSASYGMTRTVGSLSVACVLLGMKRIAGIAANASTFRTPLAGAAGAPPREALWEHAAACAAACDLLARRLKLDVVAEAFVTGLIHDIGTTVLDAVLHEDFERILELAAAERIPLYEAERRMLGTDHAHIGAWLAEAWNLPPQIASAVAAHHGPPCDPGEAPLAAALQAADAAVRAAGLGFARFSPPPSREELSARPLFAGAAYDWDELETRAAAAASEAREFLAAAGNPARPSQGARQEL